MTGKIGPLRRKHTLLQLFYCYRTLIHHQVKTDKLSGRTPHKLLFLEGNTPSYNYSVVTEEHLIHHQVQKTDKLSGRTSHKLLFLEGNTQKHPTLQFCCIFHHEGSKRNHSFQSNTHLNLCLVLQHVVMLFHCFCSVVQFCFCFLKI